jgi:hypothetical protein
MGLILNEPNPCSDECSYFKRSILRTPIECVNEDCDIRTSWIKRRVAYEEQAQHMAREILAHLTEKRENFLDIAELSVWLHNEGVI